MIGVRSSSASRLGPSADAGKLKLNVLPKITGYDSRTILLTCCRNTSASNRKVVVSDQLRTEADMYWPPRENSSDSILVNGHGPAMQNKRALRNTLPCPASSESEPMAAFHLPSGEHRPFLSQRTAPLFGTWKVVSPVPTFTSAFVSIEYRIKIWVTATSGRLE